MALPDWIEQVNETTFRVDIDTAYPLWFAELGWDEASADQYQLECVFQCTKLDAQAEIKRAGLDPRPERSLILDFRGDKERWKMSGRPEGRGIEVASKGREAREHFKRVRGFIPS